MREPGEDRERATRDLPSGEARRVLRFSSLAPGALFAGRYEIVESLGAGGSGEVFRARDRVAGHDVALKVLFPRAGAGDDRLDRPRRELGILRALSHPGIVRVFDMGEHDGLVYLVMELLEGETLRARLERVGRMEESEALRVLRGALAALAAAHEAGVVHRDVKPGNVFLAGGEGDDERVVVLDFGLARRSADATLTASGAFLGTPEYVSPEQARGEEKIGPASDLYSLGVTMWEALAGRSPFEGTSQMEILRQKLTGESVLQRAALRQATSGTRAFLQGLLAHEPSRRPRSASEAQELLARMGGKSRGLLSALASLGDFPRGGRASRGLLVLALLASLLFVGFFPWSVTTPGNYLSIRGVLGHEIGRVETGAVARDAVPLRPGAIWNRHYLVSVTNNKREARPIGGYGLMRFDVLSRRLARFQLRSAREPYRLDSGFERYDDRFGDIALTTLPDRHPNTGLQLIRVGYQHSGHFPNLTLIIEESGNVVSRGWHAGDVKQFIPMERGSLAHESGVMAVGKAVANQLGSRTAVVAFPRVTELGGASFETPPYLRRAARNGARVSYYLFTSHEGSGTRLSIEGERGVLRAGTRVALVFDLATGVPIRSEDRDGLSPELWAARHSELNALLVKAAMALGEGQERAADELADYARLEDVAKPERGVALARAAQLYRSCELLTKALRLAEEAVALEPDLTGYVRLHADLLFRTKGFGALAQRYVEAGSEATNANLVHDTVVMAGLMASSSDPSLRVTLQHWLQRRDGSPDARETPSRPGQVGPFSKRWLRLHFAGSLALPPPSQKAEEQTKTYPEYAFPAALEHFVSGDRDARAAHALIAPHRAQFGGGVLAPIIPLRAFLAARGQGEAPSREAVDAALEAQHEAGREDLRSLYWVPWAYALASGAAQAEGDTARYAALRARAEKEPGAGPWLEALLSD